MTEALEQVKRYHRECPELLTILQMEVDVLTYNSLHPLIKERILNEQEVIL
jgi:predicted nucleotidyltransferase